MKYFIYWFGYDKSLSNSLVLEVLLHVQDSLVGFTSILGSSVVSIDSGGEGSEDESGVGNSDASTTLFL
jgi:hypothetical protein